MNGCDRRTLAFSLLLLAALPSWAVVTGDCVKARGGNSCTANDVTFVLVGLGDQTDGCVNSNDTVTLHLGAKVSNTTASTRYDIGMYIYDFTGTEPAGNPPASVGYAYNGSDCARETLKPVGTFSPAETCTTTPALDLTSGSGPFLNADSNSDLCGDLVKGATCADSFMVFTDPITVKCSDGLGGTAADGFVDIPTCATWGNSADEVPGGHVNCGATNSTHPETDVLPGTGSKCDCANINSNIPAPSLSLSCSCSPTVVRTGFTNGASTACTVTFTNNVSCTPNGSTAERFRCGAASFLQFDTVAGTPNGSYIFGYDGVPSNTGNPPTETTSGDVYQPGASTVRWTPKDTNATGGGTTLGVIGHNETGTLSFNYFVNPAVPNNTTINFTTTAYWANSNTQGTDHTFSSRVSQSALTKTCSITTDVNATWAEVTNVRGREEQGHVVLRWDTAAEVGTVAFEIERRDPRSGRFVKVTAKPLPATQALPGGHYRYVDAGAPVGARRLEYRLVEVNQQGRREVLGPYPVALEQAQEPATAGEKVFTAREKAASPRLVRAGRALAAQAAQGTAGSASTDVPEKAKILIGESGLYRLGVRDIAVGLGLSAAEATADLYSGALKLSQGGSQIASAVTADGAGLVFYGSALHTAYTDNGVVWLERGSGSTMSSLATAAPTGVPADSFVDTLHIESDMVPAVVAPIPVDDFWVWKSFFPGFAGFDRGDFLLEVPSPAAAAAQLDIHLYGFAATQRAQVFLNRHALGTISWPGSGPYVAHVSLPSRFLLDGGNSIEILALEGENGFWLDSFDVTYARRFRAVDDRLLFRAASGATVAVSGFGSGDIAVYDLSQPRAPRRLLGPAITQQPDGTWTVKLNAPAGAGPFLASTGRAISSAFAGPRTIADLASSRNAADYLIISPIGLQAEAQRLADHRAGQGLATMVVDLEDVMDTFADGVNDPLAIRRFLASAVASWQVPPRYVLLAGRGSYDPRNLGLPNSGGSGRFTGAVSSVLPPLLLSTGEGIASADAELADLDGSGLPALAIGRIPALTGAEMKDYVDKVLAYENEPGGAWSQSALLLADNADPAGDFAATSDAIAASGAAGGMQLSRLYLPAGASAIQLANERLLLQTDLRDGQGLFNYVGHGGLDRLATEGLLLTTDVAGLGNAPRLPVMTALTCLIAESAYPTFSSLGEDLVLQRDGGAAALFGPTWLSYNAPAGEFGRYLWPQLTAASGDRLGDRLLRSIRGFTAAGGDRRMVQFYALLGDPALVMKR